MSQPLPSPQPTTGARRYPRTFGGLIGSMVVLVIAVLAYWGLHAFTSDDPEIKPTAVAYQDTVGIVQKAGYTIAYPSHMPNGWIATSVRFTPGDRPVWGLGILTKSGRYAGVEQEDADLRDLLTTYVDKNPRQGADVEVQPADPQSAFPMLTTWTSWSDSGGDHALAATITVKGRPQTLLVYGSASLKELETLASIVVTFPIEPVQ